MVCEDTNHGGSVYFNSVWFVRTQTTGEKDSLSTLLSLVWNKSIPIPYDIFFCAIALNCKIKSAFIINKYLIFLCFLLSVFMLLMFQFSCSIFVRSLGRDFLQRFAGLRSWRFRSTKLSASNELDTKHKTSFNHLTANFLNPLLPDALLSVRSGEESSLHKLCRK